MPPFAQPGSRIDVTAAAIGDAQNLQGGLLLLTSLRGADGQVYAVAQGPVVTGGFVAGNGGNNQTVNHPTVGRVPGGAIVERPAPSVTPNGTHPPATARRGFHHFGPYRRGREPQVLRQRRAAWRTPRIPRWSACRFPPDYAARSIEFISELEKVTVDADRPARVVINERTGTIVMGGDVHISPVAIMHGN